MITYYCPKCGSTKVEIRHKPQPEIRKPMDEMPNPLLTISNNVVLISSDYEAHCKDCGHTLPLKRNRP